MRKKRMCVDVLLGAWPPAWVSEHVYVASIELADHVAKEAE